MKSNKRFSRSDILSFSGNKAGSRNQSGLMSPNRRRTGARLMIETLDEKVLPAAMVATDLLDYAPGSTACISASNFSIGKEVTFKVSHVLDAGADGIYGTPDDTIDTTKDAAGNGHTPWTVIDGSPDDLDGAANGKITTSWYVDPDDSTGERFLLTATGIGLSGNVEVASNTFTDANPAMTLNQWESLTYKWSNGQANENQAVYLEGDVVPFSLEATNLAVNTTYAVRINLDTYQKNTDAGGFLYLDTYNKSISNLPDNFSSSISAVKDSCFTISNLSYPINPSMDFYVANADIESINYSLSSDGLTQYADVQFKANASTAELYWGQRLALPNEVITSANPGNISLGASGFTGGSLQTKIEGSASSGSGVTWITPSNAVQLQPGVVVQGSISGYKWNDLNGNGTRGSDEPGLGGWQINLYQDMNNNNQFDGIDTDTFVSSVITSNGTDLGYYKFSPVLRGTYFISETPQTGWMQTSPASNQLQGPLTISSTNPIITDINFGNTRINQSFTITKNVVSVDGGISGATWTADSKGDLVHYSISVKNTGNVALVGVNVTDQVESYGSVTLTSPSGDANYDGKLDVTETWVYTTSYAVTQLDLDTKGINGDGLLTNIATANATGVANQTATANISLAYAPSFTITKTAYVSYADGKAHKAGDLINYNITVTNTGNITLTNVNITDQVEGQMTATTVATNQTLAPGSVQVYSANYVLAQSDLDTKGIDGNANLTNTATASNNQTAPQNATANVPLAYDASYTLVKTATVRDGRADQVNDVIDYTITVTNTGNITLTDVNITDQVEKGPLVNLFVDGTLAAKMSRDFNMSHTLTQDELDSKGWGDANLTNTAIANTTEVAIPQNATANVPLAYDASYTLVKTATVRDGRADQVNDVIDYTITVTNTGNITLTDVNITDQVEKGPLVNLFVDGTLAAKMSRDFNMSHTLTQDELDSKGWGDANLTNTAIANTTEVAIPQNATANVPLAYDASYTLVKTATVKDGSADQVGDVINYNITIKNTGNITLTNVNITDQFEANTPLNLLVNGSISVGKSSEYYSNYTLTITDFDNYAGGDGIFYNKVTVVTKEASTQEANATVALKTASLGDLVWWDSNGNGNQDINETGIQGANVTLYGPNGLSCWTQTDINGKYLFSNLPLGNYTVHFDKPSGTNFLLTANGIGSDITIDSDANPATGNTTSFILTGGLNNTVDAGMFLPMKIGDFVWIDSNGDGIQTTGEPGLANVTIKLTGVTNAGVTVASNSTLSAANGSYSFSGLAPGNYNITYITPDGFIPTAVGVGTNVALDSNANGTVVSFATNGTDDLDTDFGFAPGVSTGMSATLGFWANKNGQALLKTYTDTKIGDWLASYGNLFGNLSGADGTQVAVYFLKVKAATATLVNNTYAQALTTALSMYVTGQGYNPTAAKYGFRQFRLSDGSLVGLGDMYYNVGSNGASFGKDNNTVVTVSELLSYFNSKCSRTGGSQTNLPTKFEFYVKNAPILLGGANNVFNGINKKGDII